MAHSVDHELEEVLDRIGAVRFVGRINSGVIPSDEGYRVLEQMVERESERPFISKLTHLFLCRPDSYSKG